MNYSIILLALMLFTQPAITPAPAPVPAPNFTMTTIDGKQLSLDQFRGKVVYVSFWASWCGVCKRNFRAYQPMREELERRGVVLLNVSMDKSEEKWHNALYSEIIVGTNTLVDDYDDVFEKYKLFSLPTYIILNKKGQRVALSNSDNRDVLGEFDVWLKD